MTLFFVSSSFLNVSAHGNDVEGILVSITYTAPDLDVQSLTNDEKETLIEIGWILEAEVPYWEDTTFSDNSENDPIPKVDDEKHIEINLRELFEEMDSNEDNSTPSNELFSLMSVSNPIYSPPPHGSKKYRVGDKVHCNRFNGLKTDHRHYNKLTGQGYINFWKSDCHIAIGYGYCTLVNDKCNTSKKYHRGWCSNYGHMKRSINYHLNK